MEPFRTSKGFLMLAVLLHLDASFSTLGASGAVTEKAGPSFSWPPLTEWSSDTSLLSACSCFGSFGRCDCDVKDLYL